MAAGRLHHAWLLLLRAAEPVLRHGAQEQVSWGLVLTAFVLGLTGLDVSCPGGAVKFACLSYMNTKVPGLIPNRLD